MATTAIFGERQLPSYVLLNVLISGRFAIITDMHEAELWLDPFFKWGA